MRNDNLVLIVQEVISLRNVRFTLPDELHKDLKRKAIDESISLKDLVIKALQEYIDKHPPVVKNDVTYMSTREDKE